jgi:hypothetical protein
MLDVRLDTIEIATEFLLGNYNMILENKDILLRKKICITETRKIFKSFTR